MNFVYFTDRDLGSQFPEILRTAGLVVERHSEHFKHDTPDAEWLQAVGERGWIALTHNRRIRYTPNELDAVMRHRVALLVVVGAAPYPELANCFVLTRSRIESFLARNQPPFIAKVYRPPPAKNPQLKPKGRVGLWYP